MTCRQSERGLEKNGREGKSGAGATCGFAENTGPYSPAEEKEKMMMITVKGRVGNWTEGVRMGDRWRKSLGEGRVEGVLHLLFRAFRIYELAHKNL